MTSSSSIAPTGRAVSYLLVSVLTYTMFFMFAMTTDAVGEIIKIAKGEMDMTNTQASAFHWATMVAIALSGIGLGFLADRFGRKWTIILGLSIYGLASALFLTGKSFELYFVLLFISGIAIGVFKTAALALVGDISTSTRDHTARMNAVEGFFGVGAIVGPLLVVWMTGQGLSWTWLYAIAACLCAVMIGAAALTRYPPAAHARKTPATLGHTLSLLGNGHALGFSLAIALYVACEVAIFVWLPTFLIGFQGDGLSMTFATYAVMIFFVLRAAGRFLGALLLRVMDWKLVMMVFAGAIFACFVASVVLGKGAAVFLLPLSGLFMSMMYPTLNSKGISCFPKSDHGAVAGLILFFTAVSAAFAPLLMALVSDRFAGGDLRLGFMLVTGFAGFLFVMGIWNWLTNPAAAALEAADRSDYAGQEA